MKRSPSQYAFPIAMLTLLLWTAFRPRVDNALYHSLSFPLFGVVFAIIVWYSIDAYRAYRAKR